MCFSFPISDCLVSKPDSFTAGMVQERRALAIQSKLPAATNLQKAYVRNNLALGLIQMGNLAEAKTCFLKAIELEGNGNPHIIETLSNLASLEEKTGNYAEAWTDETEAEQIAQKILPANEIGWATVRNNLGLIAFRRGDLHEAERKYAAGCVALVADTRAGQSAIFFDADEYFRSRERTRSPQAS